LKEFVLIHGIVILQNEETRKGNKVDEDADGRSLMMVICLMETQGTL
jgi:hypothetical protein